MVPSAIIIDGKLHSSKIEKSLKAEIAAISNKFNKVPALAVVLVGDDPASTVYVSRKISKAKEIGVGIHSYNLDKDVSKNEVLQLLCELNERSDINGVLIQLPLPSQLNEFDIINTIDAIKDVDGFTYKNVGLLNSWQNCLEPSTPLGVLTLLKEYLGDDLSGKKVVILGRSLIVGRPMASILIRESCSVTLLHSKSENIQEECRTADILISAVGKNHMIKSSFVKRGACVIDVGITRVGDKICGDVDFEDVKNVAGFITPVPGGVGPMTVITMLSNTVKAFKMQNGLEV